MPPGDFFANAFAYLFVFMLFIVIPAPVWVALVFVLPMLGALVYVAATR